MKRFVVTAIFIIVGYLLQTTLFQNITLAGVVPNIVLIMTAYVGYINGCNQGIAVGLFCGFIIDCQYGSVIGMYSLIYMIIGYVTGWCNQLYYRDDYTMPIVLITLSEIFYGVTSYILDFLLRGRLGFSYYFGNIIMPELMYTLIVSIFLYKILLWAYKIADHTDEGGDMIC